MQRRRRHGRGAVATGLLPTRPRMSSSCAFTARMARGRNRRRCPTSFETAQVVSTLDVAIHNLPDEEPPQARTMLRGRASLCKRKRWMSGPGMTNLERVGAIRRSGTASRGWVGAIRGRGTAPRGRVGAIPVRGAGSRGLGYAVLRRRWCSPSTGGLKGGRPRSRRGARPFLPSRRRRARRDRGCRPRGGRGDPRAPRAASVCAADRAGAESRLRFYVSGNGSSGGRRRDDVAKAEVCREDDAREAWGLARVVFPSLA